MVSTWSWNTSTTSGARSSLSGKARMLVSKALWRPGMTPAHLMQLAPVSGNGVAFLHARL